MTNYVRVEELEEKMKLTSSEELLQDIDRISTLFQSEKVNLVLKFIADMKALDEKEMVK